MKNVLKPLALAVSAAAMISVLPLSSLAADTSGVKEGSFTYMPSFAEAPMTDRYFYSDSYFTGSSSENDIHRTTMSMALALSTMEVGGSSYVSDLLTDIGFKDISVGDMNITPEADTIGTAIAHKKIGDQELVAVAIRGSKYESEWSGNLDPGKTGDHAGFSIASGKVLSRLHDYIDANGLDNVKLWITGYSRAGSAADLAGVYINENPEQFNTTPDDLFVYTFEAPRPSVSDKVYNNIHETRNRNDIINYVYPEEWGMYSNGVATWIGTEKTIREKWIDLMGDEKFPEGHLVSKEQLEKDIISYIAGNIPREKFSGDFDKGIQDLIELYFSKSPEEISQITDFFDSVQNSEGGLLSLFSVPDAEYETASTTILIRLLTIITSHSSEKAYDLAEESLNELLERFRARNKALGAELPFTDEEYETIRRSLCSIIRVLGPMFGEDGFYHRTTGYELVPESFYDPDYDPYTDTDLFPPSYDDSDDEEELTDEERGRRDGRSEAGVGWDDGAYDLGKYASYNDEPQDGEEHSEEYIAAYKEAYRDAYEEQYEYGLESKEYNSPYNNGKDQGYTNAYNSARKDAIGQKGYKAGYDDTVLHSEYDDERLYCDEFDEGYKTGYAVGYDEAYYEALEEDKDLRMNFYHFGSLIGNFQEILKEHQPQYNWELVKSLDSYYSASSEPAVTTEIEASTTVAAAATTTKTAAAAKASSKTSSPSTGVPGAAAALLGLLAGTGLMVLSSKKKDN